MPVEAFLAGLLLGVTAQLLRQVVGPLMDLGAAIAPWVTIGFALAVWTTRRSGSLRSAVAVGVGAMAAYLFAWLLSYHLLFAVRESVGFAAAWREAVPWLAVAGPACVILGLLAALSHERGLAGDACLALPIAWSVPELVESSKEGWSTAAAVALPIAALAVLPTIVSARRDVRVTRVMLAAAVAGGLALALWRVVLSQIPS